MKEEKKILAKETEVDPIDKIKQLEERQSVLDFVTRTADEYAQALSEKKLEREKEIFQLYGGGETSYYKKKLEREKILSELPQDHEPKFVDFFLALGKLCNWTEEEQKSYHKPPVAAKTIIEVIYSQFKPEVMVHFLSKNPYIKWCVRQHKHYMFLGEDGILKLEEYIFNTNRVMGESASYDDFRINMFNQYGIPYQTNFNAIL
jgi:hypothetical protein